jgi:YVTN family beta-propeller protein
MRSAHAHRLSVKDVSALLAIALVLGWPAQGWPQSITATLSVAGNAVAINRVTNKIYAASGDKAGVVTVIDGKTHSIITSVPAGPRPCAVAINEATKKIYVANAGGLYRGELFLGNGS